MSPHQPWIQSPVAAACAAFKDSGLHPIRVDRSPESPAPLRSVDAVATTAVPRLDRIRQTRGNESQASEGSNLPLGPLRGTGNEIGSRQKRFHSVPHARSMDAFGTALYGGE